MSDGDNMISEQAEGYKALFVVVVTVIEDRGCGSREDLFAVHEIDTVFTKVDFALFFAPVEFHVYDTIVTTVCSYGKKRTSKMRPWRKNRHGNTALLALYSSKGYLQWGRYSSNGYK